MHWTQELPLLKLSWADKILCFFSREYAYKKWCESWRGKAAEIAREVNMRMMGGRKIIWTREEVREQIRENARALRKMEGTKFSRLTRRVLRHIL